MTRFLLKRIGLALITLFLLSVIVFGISTILPGDVGRAVLGPFATQESVDALNEELGTDRSVFVQYVEWANGLIHGDLGTSLTKQVPTWDLLGPALENSFKLAFVAFVGCVTASSPTSRSRSRASRSPRCRSSSRGSS
jgi:peptide/nickel transport system permease protein